MLNTNMLTVIKMGLPVKFLDNPIWFCMFFVHFCTFVFLGLASAQPRLTRGRAFSLGLASAHPRLTRGRAFSPFWKMFLMYFFV